MPSPSILDHPARLARQPEFGARAGEGYAPTSARASIPVYRSVISHRVSRQHVGLAESWRGARANARQVVCKVSVSHCA